MNFKLLYIPLAGKTPIWGDWPNKGCDSTQVDRWIAEGKNVGLLTGHGALVIDFDKKNGGLETLAALEAQHGKLPRTYTVRTGDGGLHYYFAESRLFKSQDGILPGMDCKSWHGCVVTAGSTHQDTGLKYTVEEANNGKLAEAPDWLINLLTPHGERVPRTIAEVFEAGTRNSSLTSTAGAMRRRGCSEETILAALRVENRERCQPPLEDSDLRRIAQSVAGYTPGPDTFPLTGTGNAERLVKKFGRDLLYCKQMGKNGTWLIWEGTRWIKDTTFAAERLGKIVVRQMAEDAATMEGKEGKSLAGFAWLSEAESRRREMLNLAKTEEGVAVEVTRFDADPWILNCENGTLDLHTRELRPHRREDLILMRAGTAYDPAATCPLWEATLERIFRGKPHFVSYLQRWAGYTLAGEAVQDALLLAHGLGSNGKTTMFETLAGMLGDYAGRVPFETLLSKRGGDGIPNDLAALKGKRMALAVEADEGRRFNESKLKNVTGKDGVSARFLFCEFFDYMPAFKIWLATNHKPEIRGTDLGIWRRLKLVPFEETIGEAERDVLLQTRLRAEWPGVLNWALEGLADYLLDHSLDEPKEVTMAVAEYRNANDVVGDFITSKCVLEKAAETEGARLYSAFKDWAQVTGEWAMSKTRFTQRLKDRGFPERKNHRERILQGIRLKDGNPEDSLGQQGTLEEHGRSALG